MHFDFLEVLKDLVTKGHIQSTHWINGLQFGAQVIKGRGSIRIDKLDYAWD